MTLQPAPRSVRPTALGVVTYGYLITLVLAMVLGPPLSFLFRDGREQTLLGRGVLAHFDLTASRPTKDGDEQEIDYVFEAKEATGAATTRQSRESTVSNEDFAAFADPKKRFVLYDPADPANAVPVTSRSALADRREFDRKFAIWFYPASAAIILLFPAIGFQKLRRKLRLVRFGVATIPAVTRYAKDRLGRPCVEFQFTDANGVLRQARQSFNVRIGIGGKFAVFMPDAMVFFDRDDPRICELFLPRLSTFRVRGALKP